MQWSDEGLVLGARPHGEAALVAELMTRAHGRHLGLVHGGRSRRLGPVLQPGNTVAATWRARLDEQLGTFVVEAERSRAAALLASPLALAGMAALAAHLRLLPERDPHPGLFEAAIVVADHLDQPPLAPLLFIRFELALLAELGFGLDLSCCAATGATRDLAFVSPKTGRAVSRDAGAPWADKLLPLPRFLTGAAAGLPDRASIEDGFRLAEFFLGRSLYGPADGSRLAERSRFVALAVAASPSVSDMFSSKSASPGDSARDPA